MTETWRKYGPGFRRRFTSQGVRVDMTIPFLKAPLVFAVTLYFFDVERGDWARVSTLTGVNFDDVRIAKRQASLFGRRVFNAHNHGAMCSHPGCALPPLYLIRAVQVYRVCQYHRALPESDASTDLDSLLSSSGG